MALKDIFKMIKADRYTADGCEEIKKAQEAIKEETADAGLPDGTMRHRKDGDYVKQGGKWVPAPAAKKGGAGKGTTAQRMKSYVDSMNKKNGEFAGSYKRSKAKSDAMKQGQLAELNRASSENNPAEAKTYKNEEGRRDFRAAFTENPKDSYDFAKTVEKSIPMSQGDKEELKNLKSFMQDEGADYKQALRSRASNLVDGNKSNGDWYPEKEKSIMKIAKAVGYDKELHQFIEEEFKGYDLGYSEDAAPRVLTGDCKIRIRKSK